MSLPAGNGRARLLPCGCRAQGCGNLEWRHVFGWFLCASFAFLPQEKQRWMLGEGGWGHQASGAAVIMAVSGRFLGRPEVVNPTELQKVLLTETVSRSLDFVPCLFLAWRHARQTRSPRRSGAGTATATCTRCADARRIAASAIQAMAALRRLRSPRSRRPCAFRYSMGCRCIVGRTAYACTVHGLRKP